jgi:hypothetical protein
MPRGGKRTGTPGKGYSNRTDLAQNMGAQTGTTTAATGGFEPSGLTVRRPGPAEQMAPLAPEDTPFPTDASAYPSEPLTAPANLTLPPMQDPATLLIRSLMAVNPNPDLRRLLARLENR